MARLLLVNPGSGAPEWCALEVWQALSGRTVVTQPGDPMADRLVEAGIEVTVLDPAVAAPEEAPEPAAEQARDTGVSRPRSSPPALRLLGAAHAHGAADPRATALAGMLASLAHERSEVAFVLPREAAASDAIVRAVMERALRGDVEIEVVIGRAPRGHLLLDVVRTMARLRAPGGCPWDAEQTHESLARYVVDETYELLHAIEEGSPDEIAEELGDVLLQVVFHAQMGADAATFDVDDVADRLVRKLVTRHPHVFGDVEVSGADEVVANWDAIKKREKGPSAVHDDIPESLPALAWAAKLQRRAGRAGFDWHDASGPAAKVREELGELERAAGAGEREHELGDLLLAVVALSRHLDVDAETALRRAGRRFKARVAFVEAAARERGRSLDDLGEDELLELWSEAKRRG